MGGGRLRAGLTPTWQPAPSPPPPAALDEFYSKVGVLFVRRQGFLVGGPGEGRLDRV